MRKTAIVLIVCLLFALSGCQNGAGPSAREPTLPPAQATVDERPLPTQGGEDPEAPGDAVNTPGIVAKPQPADVIEIREKMFIAQTNEIYVNAGDYLGRMIKYEGIFDESVWEEDGQTYHFVIRYGPGCCPGIDNTAGFEVNWDKEYPKQDDWVEVVGVLEEYGEDGEYYLRLALTSLTVLDKRGAEYVSQ